VVNGSTLQEFSPGLAGVPAAQSSVSFVNGQTGLPEYRGIRIEELAQHRLWTGLFQSLWRLIRRWTPYFVYFVREEDWQIIRDGEGTLSMYMALPTHAHDRCAYVHAD
jgi:citrate synthase